MCGWFVCFFFVVVEIVVCGLLFWYYFVKDFFDVLVYLFLFY